MVPSKRDEVRGASKRDEVRGASKRDEVRGAHAAAMTSRKKSGRNGTPVLFFHEVNQSESVLYPQYR